MICLQIEHASDLAIIQRFAGIRRVTGSVISAASIAQQIGHQHAVEVGIVGIGGHHDVGIVVVDNDVGFLGGSVLGDDFHMSLVNGSIVAHENGRPIVVVEEVVAVTKVVNTIVVGR